MSTLKLHFLEVGQADTIVGTLATEGKCFVVDVAEATLTFNFISGVDEVSFVLITHTDYDHAGGLFDLVSNLNVFPKKIYINFDRHTKQVPFFYKELLRQLDEWEIRYGIEILPVTVGTKMDDSLLSLEVLHPPYSYLGECISKGDTNNASVVLRLEYLGVGVLLTGDIEEKGIQRLLKSPVPIAACSILKVPHHGGISKIAIESLILAVNPSYAIISCGVDNKYNHPFQHVIEALEKHGVTVVNISLHSGSGAVIFSIDGLGATLIL